MAQEISLGKDDSLRAEVLQKRLSEDFLPFFETLKAHFDKHDPGSEDALLVRNSLFAVKRAVRLVGRVFLEGGSIVASVEDLDDLNVTLDRIKVAKEQLLAKAVHQVVMRTALNEAEAKTGITADELDLTTEVSKAAKREAKRRAQGGPKGFYGATFGRLGVKKTVALGVLSQVMAPILGPLFQPTVAAGLGILGLGKVVHSVGGLIRATYKRRKRGLSRIPFNSTRRRSERPTRLVPPVPVQEESTELVPPVPVQEESTELVPPVPVQGESTRPRESKTLTEQYVDRMLAPSIPKMPPSAPVGMAMSTGRKPMNLTMKEIHAQALPTWYFFHKLAYRAKWTKEVLSELISIRKGRKTGGVGGIAGTALAAGIGGAVGAGGVAGLVASTAAALKLGAAVTALGALYQIDHTGPQGPPSKASQALTELTGIGKPEHKWFGKASESRGRAPIPTQPPVMRYMGLGSSGGERTLWGDIKAIVGTDDPYGVGAAHKKKLERGQATPMTESTPMMTPEIVVPASGSPQSKVDQKVIDQLKKIDESVKGLSKTILTSAPVGGVYNSLAGSALEGINRDGVDTLQERIG